MHAFHLVVFHSVLKFLFYAKVISAMMSVRVENIKKRKFHPLLLLVPLFCVFSRNWPPCDVTQSTDTSPRLMRTPSCPRCSSPSLVSHLQAPLCSLSTSEQQRKALSNNQAILIGRCEQECSACFHVEVFSFFAWVFLRKDASLGTETKSRS